MRADIGRAERAQHRIGQRMQPDIGVRMTHKASSCGIFTPHSQT